MTKKLFKESIAKIQKSFPFEGEIYNFVELVNPSFTLSGEVKTLHLFSHPLNFLR